MPKDNIIPAFGLPADRLQGWMMEAVAEGNIWLGSQAPATEWQSVMAVLGTDYAGVGKAAVGQSNTGYNLVRRDFREIVATLSNFKHAGEFAPTEEDSQEFFDRAHMLTNLDEHWWRSTFANLAVRDALMYAVGKGTGYLYQDWDKSRWGPGTGDVRLRACDPSAVTFVQMPQTNDIQQAYVVLIRETLPLQLAKRMYASNPSFANALVPDRDSPNLVQKGIARVQQFLSPALRAGGSIRKNNETSPVVDIWHAYTMDGSINDGHEPKRMGVNGTNWSYTVPALGDPMPQGIRNPGTGAEWTLPATPDDCLMFPLRRLTIFSRTGVCYDGSSPWWHGATPLARLRFNDLPWESLGASQLGDSIAMQEGIINLMRSVEDSAAARLDPPALYDDSRVDRAWAEGFNPRKAGVRAAADLTNGSPIEYPFTPQFYDVPPWIVAEGGFIRQQEERINRMTCAQDLVAVAKARQIPSSDTMEKLMEMAGPIVQDMAGALIQPLTELGEWRKALYFQFYTKQRMLRIADPNATEMLKNVKYVPDKLMLDKAGEAADARTSRVRSYLSDFRYDVTESGVTEINRLSRLLMYVQLAKSNVLPISWWTMARAARVPNYGPNPAGTNTELERVLAQRHMEAEMQIELAQKLQEAGGGGAPPAPGGGEEGRPATFNKAPHIVNKPAEGRSTVSTS